MADQICYLISENHNLTSILIFFICFFADIPPGMVGGISLKANIEKDADMHIIPESKKFPQVSRFLNFSTFLGCMQLLAALCAQKDFCLATANYDFDVFSWKKLEFTDWKFLHGCVKSTDIERRQHQLGRMADIPPFVKFSVFSYKSLRCHKLNLRPCSNHWWI